jgi:hypothetical protein
MYRYIRTHTPVCSTFGISLTRVYAARRTHPLTHMQTYAHPLTHMHTLSHVCKHMHILSHICTPSHTYAHPLTHMHTLSHTCKPSQTYDMNTLSHICTPSHTCANQHMHTYTAHSLDVLQVAMKIVTTILGRLELRPAMLRRHFTALDRIYTCCLLLLERYIGFRV